MNIPKNKIISMTSYFPNLLCYKTEVIVSKLLYLETMGYSKEQIKKSFINNPAIISYNNKTFGNKVDELIEIGFTKTQINSLIKKYPKIYGITKSKIQIILKLLDNNNITKISSLKIIVNSPELLGYKIQTLDNKIKFLN